MKYKYHVFVCTNKRAEGHPRGCCAQKNSVKLRNLMKVKAKSLGIDKIRINASGCLDECELGPTVVIYPEGTWYAIKTEEDVETIINEHILKGKTVKHLLWLEKPSFYNGFFPNDICPLQRISSLSDFCS